MTDANANSSAYALDLTSIPKYRRYAVGRFKSSSETDWSGYCGPYMDLWHCASLDEAIAKAEEMVRLKNEEALKQPGLVAARYLWSMWDGYHGDWQFVVGGTNALFPCEDDFKWHAEYRWCPEEED